MTENKDPQLKAKERDTFMSFIEKTRKALKYGDIAGAVSSLSEITKKYMEPENNNVDLEFARFLHTIDEKSSSQFLQQIDNQKDILSENNLPHWAKDYFQKICSGFSPSNDKQRLSFFRNLSVSFPQSLETTFLIAIALTKSAIDDKGNEKKFKEALEIYKRIQSNSPPESPKAKIWRTGSLSEQSSYSIIKDFFNWTMENYCFQLQLEDRIDEAVQLLEKEDLNDNPELRPLLTSLERELRIIKKFDSKLKKQKNSYIKDQIGILSLFFVLITVATGGFISLRPEMSFIVLLKYTLLLFFVFSLCLSLLILDKTRRVLGVITGIISLLALLFICYYSSIENSKVHGINIEQKASTVPPPLTEKMPSTIELKELPKAKNPSARSTNR